MQYDLKRLAITDKFTKDNGAPSSVFVGKDPKDEFAAIVWAPDCDCFGPGCPRIRAMSYASDHYETAVVVVRPKVAAIKPGK